VTLRLNNTEIGKTYQLESRKADLGHSRWAPGEIKTATDTNIDFTPIAKAGNAMMFFRAHTSDFTVSIQPDYGVDAIEPNPLTGYPGQSTYFTFCGSVADHDVTVYYRIGGSADNGIDYSNITGSIAIPANTYCVNLEIDPIADDLVEFTENVILTLETTNTYLVDPEMSSAIVNIADSTNNPFEVVARLDSAIGIDFHAPSNSLVVSYNYYTGDGSGLPNFALINSNGVVNTNWSTITNVSDEIKVATVKASVAGFTNGDMFFGSGNAIGWLSADGAGVNLAWSTLTNAVETNALFLRGSLHWDETGIWSNNLIAVTSDNSPQPGLKGVWQITSSGFPILAANIDTLHLEGVTTITNESKWGPWAGRILTGDENGNFPLPPLIFAVATNGQVASFDLGIAPEDFDVIPRDQDLYCVNFNYSDSTILKLSRTMLTNYVGELLITQAGEGGAVPRLFIVRWDPTKEDFLFRSITLPADVYGGHFEHVTFAPINIPPLP
jgi:hypothetical protein